MFNAIYDAVCQWESVGYTSAVLVTFAFQMLWYGPRFFGEEWNEAQGIEPTDAAQKTDEEKKAERQKHVSYIFHSQSITNNTLTLLQRELKISISDFLQFAFALSLSESDCT